MTWGLVIKYVGGYIFEKNIVSCPPLAPIVCMPPCWSFFMPLPPSLKFV